MKISIQVNEFNYSYDSSIHNKVDGDFVEEYRPSVGEAIDVALDLLGSIYGREKVAEYIKGDIPAKDYAE